MGPNLTKLFATKKNQGAGADEASELLSDLFEAHGEALIAALEELVKINEGSFGGGSERWEQLLAQLESEAQP